MTGAVDLIGHTYESVKSTLFDGLSKPGKNKETLQSELDIVKQTIESSQTEHVDSKLIKQPII